VNIIPEYILTEEDSLYIYEEEYDDIYLYDDTGDDSEE